MLVSRVSFRGVAWLSGSMALPVVSWPARTINCASCPSLAEVFSSAGSLLFRMPWKIVSLPASGSGEFLISSTCWIQV
jgi:hypothetical protein